MRLENKVAIVTGASSGIGRGIAEMFAKEGAKVVLTDVKEDEGNLVAANIIENQGEAIFVRHDVSKEEEWEKVINLTKETYGKIDILVNNAGVTGNLSPAESVTLEEWDQVININLKGTVLGMKHVIPELKAVGGGSIVNISSISGIVGGGSAAYCASKGGVRTLTKNVALDYAKDKIRVNSIHPGVIVTSMTEFITSNEEVAQTMLKDIPLNTFGRPEDIAYGAVYLASDESRFVTGAEFVIDGGQIAK